MTLAALADVRPPPRSTSAMRGPAYLSAGIRPKSSPDSREIASVNASARPSRPISFRRGSVRGRR